MILEKPFYDTKPNRKYIGFWASNANPFFCGYAKKGILLPFPAGFIDDKFGRSQLKNDFLEALDNFQKSLKPIHYMGWSNCRLCKEKNGGSEFDDGVFIWPEGFSHYVRVHNVKPAQEFMDHILITKGI
jgi:hypothetical protein